MTHRVVLQSMMLSKSTQAAEFRPTVSAFVETVLVEHCLCHIFRIMLNIIILIICSLANGIEVKNQIPGNCTFVRDENALDCIRLPPFVPKMLVMWKLPKQLPVFRELQRFTVEECVQEDKWREYEHDLVQNNMLRYLSLHVCDMRGTRRQVYYRQATQDTDDGRLDTQVIINYPLPGTPLAPAIETGLIMFHKHDLKDVI